MLRQHHRLVRAGRLNPAPYRRRIAPSRIHVIDREELSRTRADATGSWLHASQGVARACGTDDEVARIAGPALRRLLWASRDHLGSEHVTTAFAELRRAAEDLVSERRRYCAAVDQWVASGRRSPAEENPASVRRFAQDDIESIRLEIRVLVAVQQQWRDTA